MATLKIILALSLSIIALMIPALGQTDASYWFNQGMELYIQDNITGSLQAYNTAIQLDPSYAEAWYNMGAVYDYQGDYPSAVHAYNEAITFKPDYQKALESKASDEDILLGPSLSCGCSNQLPYI